MMKIFYQVVQRVKYYGKTAILVKYMIEIFLNAPIELQVLISYGVLMIIWSLNRHN